MPTAPRTVIALALLAFVVPGTAADWKPLRGTYAVTAEHYLDPPENEPKDSHFRVQLSGDSARALFLSMKVPEAKDECTGGAMKRIGEMRCVHHKAQARFECSFSINVMNQKIEQGVAC